MAKTMDAKDIEARAKTLQKAQNEHLPASAIITQLKALESAGTATEAILRSTRVGQIVAKCRQNKDPEVQRMAAELVTKWKKDMQKPAAGAKPTSTSKASNGTGSPAPAIKSDNKPKAKLTVPPEKRNAQTDGVDIAQTGSKIRDNCLKLMYDGLSHMSEDAPADVLAKAIQVEAAAYEKFKPETSDTYKTKMRSLFQNLKNKSNPQLRKRVLGGEIAPSHFVVMSHDELKSAERRAEDALLQKENMNKAMVAQEEKSISTSLVCSKCHEKRVSYSQAQTRSADEPMTTFCECMNCGKRWKFS